MELNITKQQLETAGSSPLFRDMDEMAVERIVSDEKCSVRTYEKGEVIFDDSHFVRALGIVLRGQVQVEQALWGKKLQMSRIHPGGCFGAAAMFREESHYPTLLTAAKPAEILFLPEEVLTWYMQRNPVLTENYIAFLSERIRFLNTIIATLTAGTSEQKLAVYLLEYGDVAASMTGLSQTLNMGRATLYRGLSELERRGLIEWGNKSVRVLDLDGLGKFVK